MAMKQKDAVYQAVLNVCGEQDGVYEPTKEQRSSVNAILFEGVRAGSISIDTEFDDAKLKQYVSGLQSNWLRKDTRLNGGVKYVAKNPGSRTGNTDPSLKAMRLLLSTKTDATERAEIQTFIDARVAEIKPTKETATLSAEQIVTLEAAGLGHLISN